MKGLPPVVVDPYTICNVRPHFHSLASREGFSRLIHREHVVVSSGGQGYYAKPLRIHTADVICGWGPLALAELEPIIRDSAHVPFGGTPAPLFTGCNRGN